VSAAQATSRLGPEAEAALEIYIGYARSCRGLEQRIGHAHKPLVEHRERAASALARELEAERMRKVGVRDGKTTVTCPTCGRPEVVG
jgi:hypothetical protein